MRMFALVRAFVLLMWPVSLFAAPALSQSLEGVPGAQWFLASFLSTLGGVTAFFFQLNAKFDDPNYKPITKARLWVMLGSQMFCSWLAGAVFFLLGLHWSLPFFLLGATVAVSSFMGAKALDIVASRMFKNER